MKKTCFYGILITAGLLFAAEFSQAKRQKVFIEPKEKNTAVKPPVESVPAAAVPLEKTGNEDSGPVTQVGAEEEAIQQAKPPVPEEPVQIVTTLGLGPKNIILMMPTGMGLSSYCIAKYYSEFVKNKSLNMDYFFNKGVTGYVMNSSEDFIVPDNAAAMSAMVTGHKVKNGTISITQDGKKPESAVIKAKKLGLKTGIVTTCEITDTLPAALTAHVENEDMKDKVAEQQLDSGIDVLMGGGLQWFDVKKRVDGKNLLEKAQKMGYTIVTDSSELSKIRPEVTGKILGLFSDRMMDFVVAKNKTQPSLSHMVRVALGTLDKADKGFLLVVEGGRIAHAAIGNLTEKMVGEIIAFDEALSEVLDYIQNKDDTLVIITPGVDIGSPVLSKRGWEDRYMQKGDFEQLFTKGDAFIIWPVHHNTATPVFITALGPGSEAVSGMHEGAFLSDLMEINENDINKRIEIKLLKERELQYEALPVKKPSAKVQRKPQETPRRPSTDRRRR